MPTIDTVLTLDLSQQPPIVRQLAVTPKTIPESLNGESGFHIYYVYKLTQLLLTQLQQTHHPELTDDDIEAIAAASSLHDIGKSRVPQSILNFPGRLSPLEYDIVKKHSIFGEELILAADFGQLPPALSKYAAQIARYHHERIDGTGYPEGLREDQIPLCALVVALADSYDALTSNRSYKDAFSQDVAIQMIASGMCGVFPEYLIDCLLQVVGHSTLVSLRQLLQEKRAVVEDPEATKLKRVLCIGNTGYITKEFIENTFPESRVTVIGNNDLTPDSSIQLFRVKDPSVKVLFETYDFDAVVYFSGDLTYRTTEKSDAELLRTVLKYAPRDTRLLFLSSLDGAYEDRTDRSILSCAKEQLCEFYAQSAALDVKILRIPYLYDSTLEKDFLFQCFDTLRRGKRLELSTLPESRMHFISLLDLSRLIVRLLDNWRPGSGILTVGDEFSVTFGDFARQLQGWFPNAPLTFTGTRDSCKLTQSNKGLRSEYGWFAKISITEDLPEQYEKYLASRQEKGLSLWQRLKKWLERHSLFIKLLELVVLFLLTEFLLQLTDSAVIFSIVDFRMAYIVMMATVHGLNFGLSAATLSSLSWLVAKVRSGTNLLTIFYEPTNWLAFVFFYLIGALCGYIKLRSDDTIRFVTQQNKLLEDKLVFTRELYEDTYREKRDLKKQIIGSRDSFGKIFDITRRLDTVAPQKLYLQTMETFEDVLENKSITVYSVNPQSTFGRLEVASRDILDTVSRSISTETYREIIESLQDGQIWRNTGLKLEFPMYAAGVYRGQQLQLLIFLWRTDLQQRSLYYVNLFKILRDLMQMSLLRAYDYNQAIYDRQFIPGTHIMTRDAFREVLDNYRALAEKKLLVFTLLELDFGDLPIAEADRLLTGKIRANDTLGQGEAGRLQLLLSQAQQQDLQFILPRFRDIPVDIYYNKERIFHGTCDITDPAYPAEPAGSAGDMAADPEAAPLYVFRGVACPLLGACGGVDAALSGVFPCRRCHRCRSGATASGVRTVQKRYRGRIQGCRPYRANRGGAGGQLRQGPAGHHYGCAQRQPKGVHLLSAKGRQQRGHRGGPLRSHRNGGNFQGKRL